MTPAGPEPRPQTDDDNSIGAWALVWVICLTKLATLLLVLVTVHTREAAALLAVTSWFWLGPLLALGAAPLLFRLRLRRVRARRRALLAAEWQVPGELDRAPLTSR